MKLDRRELSKDELYLYWLRQLIASVKLYRKLHRKAGLGATGEFSSPSKPQKVDSDEEATEKDKVVA